MKTHHAPVQGGSGKTSVSIPTFSDLESRDWGAWRGRGCGVYKSAGTAQRTEMEVYVKFSNNPEERVANSMIVLHHSSNGYGRIF